MSEDTESWRDSLPEGLRDAPFIKAAETPEAALQDIQNAASYMGNSIRIPSEEAGDEDRQAFITKIMEKAPNLMMKPDLTDAEAMQAHYRTIGMPEKAEDYRYEPPEGKEMPSDLENFSKIAHKFGLSQQQFEGVIGDLLGGQWEQAEMLDATHKDEIDKLKQEWGDAYDDRVTAVKNFLKLTDAPEGIVDLITEGAMSAAEIAWLQGIASQTKAPTELVQQQSEREAALTPEEAQNQIQEMMNNSAHPYWNAADPRHKQAIKRMLELQKFANPDALEGDAALMNMRA